MTVGALAVMTKVIFSIHMTDTNDSWGSGSVGKRYKWHMHMTKEVVGVVAVMTDGITLSHTKMVWKRHPSFFKKSKTILKCISAG